MRGYWTDVTKADYVSPLYRSQSLGSVSVSSTSSNQRLTASLTEVNRRSNGKIQTSPLNQSPISVTKQNGPVEEEEELGQSLDTCNSSSSLLQHAQLQDDVFSASKTRDSVQLTRNHIKKPIMSSSSSPILEGPSFTPYSPVLRRKRSESIESEMSNEEDKESYDNGTENKVNRPVKRPVITEEMLQKHSLHYLLMNNFFLSDSDDSLAGKPLKKVRFNLEPEVIQERNYSDYVFIEAGAVFQTRWETLERHQQTLLGSDEKWQYYDNEKDRFIFDVIKLVPFDQKEYPGVPDEPVYVKPECFESVLFYYQDLDNTLRCPKGVKSEIFMDTLKFFKINSRDISVGPYERGTEDHFEDLVPHDANTLQTKLFLLLYHKTSLKTKVYTIIDVIFIITSVISCISATLPMNRPPNLDAESAAFFNRFSAIQLFVIIDGGCMIWFFILFILHFLAAPVKIKFFTSFQTVIDIIILTAFCLFIAVAHTDLSDSIPIKHFIRLTFSFRILRLSRHSLLLNSLGLALKEASRELLNVLMFLLVIVVLFGCLEYFMEVEEPGPHELNASMPLVNCSMEIVVDCINNKYNTADNFPSDQAEEEVHLSILEYVWWSLITITTVGYGTPEIHTTAGKIVGSMCAIAGVPLFAIPIPILSKHLERVYQREVRKNEYMKDIMAGLVRGGGSGPEGDEEESEEEEAWTKIIGERRKSMGPQFSMTHFSA